MKCVRRKAGAHRPAASIPSRSPSSRPTPTGDRSRPDPRGGRARLSLVLPALALLLVALGLFVAAPAKAQLAGGDLISNTGQSVSVQEAVFRDAAQSFTTGSDPEGYTLTGVDLVLQHTSTTAPVYDVNIYTDSSGRPSILIGPLNSPSSLPSAVNGVARYTAEGDGIALSADTTYWVVFDVVVPGTGTVARALTQSTAEDSGAAKGWSIGNGRLHRDHNASTWLSSPHSMKMALHGIDGDSVTHYQVKVSDFQVDTVETQIRVRWRATNDWSSLCCGYLIEWLRKTNVHASWYGSEYKDTINGWLAEDGIPVVGKWRSERYFDSGHRPAYVVGYGAEDSGCVAGDGSLRDNGYLLPGLEYEVRVSVLGPPGQPARLVYSTTVTTEGDTPYWARPYSEFQQRRSKPEVSPPPPVLESARVSRAALSLVFDVDLDESSVPSGSAFAVTAAGSARAVSSVAVSGRDGDADAGRSGRCGRYGDGGLHAARDGQAASRGRPGLQRGGVLRTGGDQCDAGRGAADGQHRLGAVRAPGQGEVHAAHRVLGPGGGHDQGDGGQGRGRGARSPPSRAAARRPVGAGHQAFLERAGDGDAGGGLGPHRQRAQARERAHPHGAGPAGAFPWRTPARRRAPARRSTSR